MSKLAGRIFDNAPIGGGRERLGAAMQRLLLVVFILLGAILPAWAQEECKFGGEAAANALERTLSQAKSCGAAAAKLNRCAWGSSADLRFASIVIEKCEKTILDKFSPSGKKRYEEELQLCSYRYAQQEGTRWISAEAVCEANLAASFAANPGVAGRPASRASFDCDKAQTALEKAICSDVKLGKADIVLSRAYSSRLKNSKEDRPALIRNERRWLQTLPAECNLTAVPLSQDSVNCLREAFEERFTVLDSCIDKIDECSSRPPQESGYGKNYNL